MAHPLDPLSSEEFATVAQILRCERDVVPPGWRFASIEMVESAKAELTAFETNGTAPARRATVICFDRSANATYKSVVSLTDDRVDSFEHVPGVQPNFTGDEFIECDQMLRSHPEVLAALAKRGITDIENVFMDTWTYGEAVTPPEYRDRRLGWTDAWRKDAPGANPYAHLISGLHCVIDVNAMELLTIEDSGPFSGGRRRDTGRHGRVRPEAHSQADSCRLTPRTAQASAHRPARRAIVHGGRQSAHLAELVAAGRIQLSRGHDTAHRAVHRR